MVVTILCLFLAVSQAGLQCVNVAFTGHTHLLIGRGQILCRFVTEIILIIIRFTI